MKTLTKTTPAIATFEGGGDMLVNVLNKTLDIGVGEVQEIRSQLDAGRIRLLAVVGDERLAQFADLPTAREQGVDISVRKFRGLAGPKGTPPAVIAAWEAAVPKLLEDPQYKKIYSENNLQAGFIPHAQYVTFINDFGQETESFLKESGVIK
jgi:tripartite-type tricarboxylate transporter receptor subunit TctC